MPLVSQAQAHLFYAAKNGYKYATESIPQKVASKFIKDTNHQKLSSLPERVSPQKNIQQQVGKHQQAGRNHK